MIPTARRIVPQARHHRRLVAGGGACVTLAAILLGLAPVTGHAASILTSRPTADAEVQAALPAKNFGTRSRISADGSPLVQSFLKFDVTGVAGAVQSAKLRLRVSDSSTNGPAVRSTGTGWSETGVTYATRPATTTGNLDNKAAISSGTWIEYDVSSAVKADGSFGFALVPESSDGAGFSSRETAYSPELRVTSDPATTGGPDTTAPTAFISSPANGTVISASGSQPIAVDVRDDRAVAKVEFYDGTRLDGTETSAPFTHAWSPSAADSGAHRWSIRAYDAAGNVGVSAPVDVTVGILAAEPTPTPTTPAPSPTGVLYYVDAVAGSDANAGTSESSAWQSLSKASSAALKAGDQLLLRRGQRWTGTLTMAESGTAAEPITVSAFGTGAAPEISGASTCVSLTSSFVVVRDLTIGSCTWAGVGIGGGSNVVRGNLITGNAAGIDVKSGAAGNRILDNRLEDNNRMSVLTSTPTDDDSGAFAILLKGDGTEVAGNIISGSDAFSYDYGRDGAAVEIYGAQRSWIHHNVAVDNDAFSELGNSRSADNSFAYNVVRSSLATSTFLVTRGAQSSWGPVLRTRLHNNTVRLTGPSSQGVVCHAGCSTDVLQMRNNVIGAVAKAMYADAPADEDHDLFFGGPVQTTKGTHSVFADPGFQDTASGNLRLSSLSRGVDMGVGLGYTSDLDGASVPFDGNGDGLAVPDAGAYERH